MYLDAHSKLKEAHNQLTAENNANQNQISSLEKKLKKVTLNESQLLVKHKQNKEKIV